MIFQVDPKGKLKSFSSKIFRYEEVKVTPWPRMILCAVATLLPIMVGLLRGETSLAIFGAMSGYLLVLNDHMGSLGHRLWVTTLSAFILTVGFALGFRLHGHPVEFLMVLAFVAYWLGLLGGEGAELERAVLFALVSYITAYTTSSLTADVVPRLIPYAALGYLCLMVGGPTLHVLRPLFASATELTKHASLRGSLQRSFTRRAENHLHAVVFVAMVVASVWLSGFYHIEHGSWITITVLIILRPDRMGTVYKTFQRFAGTIAGVAAADLFLLWHPSVLILIAVLGLCSFAIPWAMQKSYWLTSFIVTLFVIVLLELAALKSAGAPPATHMATLRLEATSIGCALSLCGVLVSRTLDRLLLKKLPA